MKTTLSLSQSAGIDCEVTRSETVAYHAPGVDTVTSRVESSCGRDATREIHLDSGETFACCGQHYNKLFVNND